MSDGSSKKLGDIRVGDKVVSFDEATGKAAVSEVMAVPVFHRQQEELVELRLPSASILATEDHPLWSRNRGRLVSLHPNGTKNLYDLDAELLAVGDELEDESQQPVPVLAAERLAIASAIGQELATPVRSLRGVQETGGSMQVLTLCLQPHHWYYVHGVRVHNKGCFLTDTEVTLADGSRKPLRDISVGDKVASWDEAAQRPAVSTVKATPTFKRREDELVHLSLPGASIVATEDHPFWSRNRRGLVSLHPNGTLREYELAAQLLAEGEELENERGEAVNVLGVRRAAELQLRQLRGAPVAGAEPSFPALAEQVEVMTLCLEPHHWFYARGVRVHNKGGGGCFAPWTPITMADGALKSIEDVKVNDQVASWDEKAGSLAKATVVGVDVFDGRSMLEVLFNAPREIAVRQLRTGDVVSAESREARALIVTPDHPIYSARAGGAVSMWPNTTLSLYAMTVGQMHDREMLHHQGGQHLPAEVRRWAGNTSTVMTLRLDRHHWFYAEGVRVHNKGGSSGGGFGGGTVTHTRASMGYPAFAGFVILNGGSRRRYGTYHNEEGSCTMASASSVSSTCMSTVAPYCNSGDALVSTSTAPSGSGITENCCHDCLACESTDCINTISGCESFLAQSFSECTEEEGMSGAMIALIIAGIVLPLFGFLGYIAWKKQQQANAQSEAVLVQAELRANMVASQGMLPPNLVFAGTYTENGETKTTSYNLTIQDGYVTGQSQDDDGVARIVGTVNAPQGIIAMCETRTGVTIEISGNISMTGTGSYQIQASYVSSYAGTTGTLFLLTAAMGTVVTETGSPMGQVVQAQVVGNTFVPGMGVTNKA